jgi:beta-galactosidase
MKKLVLCLLLLSFGIISKGQSGTFSIGKNTFLLNGTPFVIKAAEIHYPRIPDAYWEHRIKMCKALE